MEGWGEEALSGFEGSLATCRRNPGTLVLPALQQRHLAVKSDTEVRFLRSSVFAYGISRIKATELLPWTDWGSIPTTHASL